MISTLRYRHKRLLPLLILAIISSPGCIHKSNNQSATYWEKVTTYNATFAQTNQVIEQGAESLSAQQILSLDQARSVVTFCARNATIHQQITQILGKGAAINASDISTLEALLDQVKASATQLIQSGYLGIKNPKTQNTVVQDLKAVYDLADLILSLVTQLQNSPAPPAKGTAAPGGVF
jgi:hypothetical protein